MAKRIKYVVDTEAVAHLWMHKAQDSARNGRNFYFDGDTIYSYGSHFPIARHVSNKSGRKQAILFTTRDYSVTTSSHKNIVRGAMRGNDVPVFHVHNPASSVHGALNVERYVKQIQDAIALQAKARATYRLMAYANDAQETKAECIAYCKFFGLKNPKFPKLLALPADLAERQAREKERDATRNERREANRERRHAELMKQNAEAVARYCVDAQSWLDHKDEHIRQWMAGGPVGIPSRPWYAERGMLDGVTIPEIPELPTMLRIVGDEVETSRHASFPIAHAKRGLALVRSVMARGKDWETNGHTCHLGPYKINRITADGTVYAGCHVVPWESIARIAPMLDGATLSHDGTPISQAAMDDYATQG